MKQLILTLSLLAATNLYAADFKQNHIVKTQFDNIVTYKTAYHDKSILNSCSTLSLINIKPTLKLEPIRNKIAGFQNNGKPCTIDIYKNGYTRISSNLNQYNSFY